jgi:hypothetical protein
MHRLPLKIAFFLLFAFGAMAQSPHGKGFDLDCAQCHDSKGWALSKKSSFEHSSTGYVLDGQHKNVNCNTCHTKLDFKKTATNCNSCHQDVHNQTVGNDCERCHTTQSWIVQNIAKLHDQTSFPLVGVHKTVDCNQCHTSETNLNYKPIGGTCIDCHSKDYKASKNPDHSKLKLSTDCSACHSTSVSADWATTSFANHNDFYPLTGAHAAIARDCEKCHIGCNYTNTPTDCSGCHKNDFAKTVNPNHTKLNLSMDCISCHTTAPGWSPAKFPVHNEFYPLTGAHTAIANNCTDCHKGGNFNNTPNDCISCHSADYTASVNPNHKILGFSTDCVSCHTTAPGWSPATFAAHDSYYPLTGAHKTISCNECHKGGSYNGTSNDCNSCHNAAFKATQNPNHQSLGFPTDCAACHSTAPNWTPAKYDAHNTFYPLTGAHSSISCNECHKGGNYSKLSQDCNACHSADFNSAKNPNHKELGISTDCVSCHTTNPGWRPSTFNHNTYFPLEGAHSIIKNNCSLCHKGGNVKNASSECNSCHNAAYQGAKNPNHSAMGLSTNCAECHTANPGWTPSIFDHNKYFSLTGGHAIIAKDCNKCHTGSNYKNPPTDCNSCHNTAYKNAISPNHVSLGISTNCSSCHTTSPGWKPSTFNHNSFFPLTGAHATIGSNCVQCHTSGVSNTPNDCNACHNSAYKNAQNPNHGVLGISTDCASCHTTNPGWRPSTFNHNNYYVLTGAHAAVANNCTQCHAKGVGNTSTDCNSCHNGAFQSAKNPNHASSGFSTDCESCHSTNPGWRPSTFNHNNIYPLTGAHASVATNCTMCHAGGRFKNTPTDCNSCHNGAYQGAKNPNHAASGFSTDCASCHTTNPGWRPSTFNHNNFYPLTGAHANVASSCTSCHANGNYNNTPTDCNSCHSSAFNGASNPNHVSSGFSRDCASCHTTNPGWRPSTFNHNNYYPIVGAHTRLSCTQCHTGGSYNGTSNQCVGCHQNNYNGASPNHKSSGFSTNCIECHSQNAWKPATFNHDAQYFPIYSGEHKGEWNSCTDCHTSAGNYSVFSCFKCHSQSKMDKEHKGKSGYSYNSSACLSCHPKGK